MMYIGDQQEILGRKLMPTTAHIITNDRIERLRSFAPAIVLAH